MPFGDHRNIVTRLAEHFAALGQPVDHETAVRDFLMQYETIFEINLLAEKAVKNLESLLRNENIAMASVLNQGVSFDIPMDSRHWMGNSLDISDESPFVGSPSISVPNAEWDSWFSGLAEWKKQAYLPVIERAKAFHSLREIGRCLTVGNISRIRSALRAKASGPLPDNPLLAYFSTLDEIADDMFSREVLTARKSEYQIFSAVSFPKRLTSEPVEMKTELLGISMGSAKGKLVTLATMTGNSDEILCVDVLSPDIAEHLSAVSGVLSATGGLLSHLAIIARERGIPVIANFDLQKSGLEIGAIAEMVVGQSGAEIHSR